jgi:general secretion pathway protein G
MIMRRNTSNSTRNDDGFSLVELLIVIVVLGIIAAVTVFSVRGVTARGEESSCHEDLRLMHTAAESYFAQYRESAIPTSDPAVAGVAGPTAEDTLVEVGLLSSSSTLHDVDADGQVTPQSGSRC